MKISEIVTAARSLLQDKGRASYRLLKMEFALDDEQLDVLREELIDIEEVAADKDGEMLVWTGDNAPVSTLSDSQSQTQSPASYTPHHLAKRILAEHAAIEARGSANGERKTITALFADLKGSTALIEGLDPEEARAIIDPALQLMMDAVHRYDGYVAQALGDGIFALFGAPIAHEDHPQRALYAALRMQEAMCRYSDKLREEGAAPLQMRVGVNTGEVVVRSIHKDDLHADYVPIGHSTNIAARMEQLANPGSILVTEQTYKLTDGYFEFSPLGKTKVKGIEAPIPIYEVTGAGPLRTRFQVTARRGLTRFVGRRSELDQIQRALEQAKSGHGQIVSVMGEPGLGKSRLVYEFVGAVREPPRHSQRGCLVLEAFAVSHGKASPYLPVIELLKTYFQLEPSDDERIRKEKMRGRVLTLDRSLEETLPYLFALLGIEDDRSSLQQMDAQIRRQRTFEALKQLFLRESLNQPLLLLFEDLHWIDTETQGFLDVLSESIASAALLLLVNYRPEYRHEWGKKTYYTQLCLAPLGRAEAEDLSTSLLGSHESLPSLKELIVEKTEGTPFFMEEVVQTLAEDGVLIGERGHYRLETTPTELYISPTVQGVLAARIDRLAVQEKELLQQLSVIGRQFSVSLIKHVVQQSEAELHHVLSSLQAKEFLYEQPAFPEVEYLFKHALTQEVAYSTVLHEQRKVWHERTAVALEALYKDSLEDHYGELARHYRLSGNAEKAVEYLHLAGQQAVQRSANPEAVSHLTAALELLKGVPDTPERLQHELSLQITLGGVLTATKGYATTEVETVYSRALQLCQQDSETPQLFPVMRGLWVVYIAQGKLHRAQELGEQLLSLAQSRGDPVHLVEVHFVLGVTLCWLGEFVSARRHLEQGRRLYDPQQHRSHVLLYGEDSGVLGQGYAAWVLWFLGYPQQALEKSHEMVTLAQELCHPFSLAQALLSRALLHRYRRERQAGQKWVEAVITLSTEQGFPQWLALGIVLRGATLAEQEQAEEGIAQMHQGLATFRALGVEATVPYFLALLAEGYGKVGQPEEGLKVIGEALSIVDKTGERFHEAEVHRLKGELILNDERGMLNDERKTQEAEACFQQALSVARRQKAKSWELRAATSLARLWQSQSKTAEAYALLAPVYEWFTEGFDTADLKDAKALLTELPEGV